MTKTNQQCHSPDNILAFLRGQLTSSEEESLQLHLDDCVSCRKLLSNSAADETAWAEAHQFFSSEALYEGQPELIGPNDEQAEEPESIESLLKLLGPTDDPRMLGRIGPYEIVGVLGRGGMGVVFKAYEPSLNRYVAIKLLLPHLAASGAARMRFAREGRAAAAVIDDNVLPIFSVAEWQGTPYLVTQLSRGTNLQKRINDSGPLELREILRLGMQTASGLAAAHAQGLVHRDVKPSNILLDGTVDRALLTDFGLARAVDDASITCSGMIAGTPQYMSPEQARGGAVDARSDLFGLGSVLYTMCTGRPPFRAENSFAVLRLITDVHPREIREVNPDIPEWLCAIIEKLMAKSPEDRNQSAAEVAELLSACLAHVQQPTVVGLPSELRETIERNRFAKSSWNTWRRTMAHYITYRMPYWLPCFLTTLFAFAVSLGPAMSLSTLPKETFLHSIPPATAVLIVTAIGFVLGLAITLSAKRVANETDAAELPKKLATRGLLMIGAAIIALAVVIPWFMRQTRLSEELLDFKRQALASTERKQTEQAGLALSVPFKSPDDAVVDFELVNQAGDGSSLTINQYVRGVCLSHDGLVVTATPRSVFDQAQSVSVFSPYKGKTRVVAEDKDHSLTLLQLDVADKSTYFWLKCRSELPVLGQRLIALGASQKPIPTVVSHVNRAFQKPRKGSDGFLMQPFALPQPGFPVEDALWRGLPTGSAIISTSDELQGLAVDSSGLRIEPPSGDENPNIPALHIQNLLTAYQQAVEIEGKTDADQQTGEINGYLKNTIGEPIRNATIACSSVYDKAGRGGGANAITDAEGRYRFSGLTEGIYSVWLKHYENPHFTAIADDGIEVTGGQPTTSSISLVPTIHVTGLLTHEGIPATTGTAVLCYCNSRPESSATALTSLTDEQGRFAFDLPLGRASFVAMGRSKESNALLVAKSQLVVGQAKEPAKEPYGDVHLVLRPQQSQFGSTDWLDRSTLGTEVIERKTTDDITGTIVDTEGKPIEAAKVFTAADLQPVQSDTNGFFKFPKAKGTQTIMRAFKPGYHIWMGMPTAGDRLKIVLEKKESKQTSTRTNLSKVDAGDEMQRRGEAGVSETETDSLALEVDRVNRDLHRNVRPSTQPPLTRDEVIAVASWNEGNADLLQPIKDVLAVIATQHRLTAGWRFAAETRDMTQPDSSVKVFRIFLVKDGSEQKFLIRERFVTPLNKNHNSDQRNEEQGSVPLSAAIASFNSSHNVVDGIKQLPLTEDEAVAAILCEQTRRNRHHVDDALFQRYQDIARTRTLPKDAAIEVIPTFETPEGSTFTIWSVRIRLPNSASDESKGTFAFTIREQFVSVKHSDAGEIHWGTPAADGIQVGARLRPPLKNYSIGQKVVVEIVYRNVLTKSLEASIPNIPHYEIEARDARGNEVQSRNPSLDIVAGYQLERMIDGEPVTRTAQRLMFAPKSVESDAALSEPAGIQTLIFVEAGESYRIRFAVPDPSSDRTERLTTGEIEVKLGVSDVINSDDKRPPEPVPHIGTESHLTLRSVELNGERLIELARGKNKQTASRFTVQTDAGRIEVTPSAAGQMKIVRDKLEMFAGELTLVSSPEHLKISASVN